MKKLIQFLLLAILSSPLWGLGGFCFAQYPTQLKDINTTGETSPKGFITYNNVVYYTRQ